MNYIKILLPLCIESLNKKEFLSEAMMASKNEVKSQLNHIIFETIFKLIVTLSLFILIIYSLLEINKLLLIQFSKYQDSATMMAIYFSSLILVSSIFLYQFYQKTKDKSDKSLIKLSNSIELNTKSLLIQFLKGILEGISNIENHSSVNRDLINIGDKR